MSQNLYEAHRQWATRPADERFETVDDLLKFTEQRKQNSRQYLRPLSALSLAASPEGGLQINGQHEPAVLTNWSFSQLAGMVGAPAAYLRTLPPPLVHDCLSYALKRSGANTKVLLREATGSNGSYRPAAIGALTGPKYGRIWDAEVVEALMNAVEGTAWRVPKADVIHNSDSAGLYASDRDVFAFFINDDFPVEIEGARLSWGFFCWNSETGKSSLGLTTFLYNHVCGNHIVWGADYIDDFRIIHRSNALSRFHDTIIPALNRFVESPESGEAMLFPVHGAMKYDVAEDLEGTYRWFKDRPFTQNEIKAAWEAGIGEDQDVTKLWGLIQGLTSVARWYPNIDRRVDLDRRAGALLALAA